MTTAECIHGFEPGLCDICFPRERPEPPKVSRATPRRVSGTAAVKPAPRVAPVTVDLHRQRGYHITHLDNLEAILADGELKSDAAPAVDVSSSAARELRRTTELAGGGTVADRVAFYLSPDAFRWDELRSGAHGATWSDAARASRAQDYVVLVTAVDTLGAEAVLADGDAAATLTRFAPLDDTTTAVRMLRRMIGDEGAIGGAELLGPSRVPVEGIQLIVVANEPVRDRVRPLIRAAGLAVKVSVNPPWFTPTEKD